MFKCMVFCAVVLLFLSACSAKSVSYKTKINYQAAGKLNLDLNQNPAPIDVLVYQLKKDTAFKKADFADLSQHPVKVLGGDLLDLQELMVRPKQQCTKPYVILPETRYIGVVAGYRTIDQSKWSAVIKTSDVAKKGITVTLGMVGVYVIPSK